MVDDGNSVVAAAASLLKEKRATEAEALLRARVASDPTDSIAVSNLGVALSGAGRHAEAAQCFERAIELKPDSAEAHYNLGTSRAALGKATEAAGHYRRAGALAASNADLLTRIGRALVELERLDDAIALYRSALRRQPRSQGLLFALGLACRSAGLADEAIASFREILRSSPTDAQAAYHAGDACLCAGRTEEAIALLSDGLRWFLEDRWQANPQPPAADTRFDSGAARRILFAVEDALGAAGIQCFLVGGTALGCVREGDFISFDHDIDVGVLPGAEAEKIIDAIAGDSRLGFSFYDVWLDRVLRVRFASSEGIGGDVFLYQEDADGYWCGLQHGPIAVRWRDSRFGLAERPFLGRTVLVPDPVERYLAENYGDWRTPDPHHIPVFSAPNLIGGYSEYARGAVYSCIIAAIAAGDAPAVRRYCTDILARDPGDALIAQIRERFP